MKKLFFFSILYLFSLPSWSQSKTQSNEGKNEVYFNAFNIVMYNKIEFSYERSLNRVSSIGLAYLEQIGANESIGDFGHNAPNLSITSYYRLFFGKKYSQGFFIETFATYNSGIGEVHTNHSDYRIAYKDLAIGTSLGLKLVSKKGFIAEGHFGVGRNLYNDIIPNYISRLSLSMGYRF